MLSIDSSFVPANTTSITVSPFSSASSASSPDLDLNLDLDLTLLPSDASAAGLKREAALNDFNIAQLQLQYESNSMDTALDTLHPLDQLDILHVHHAPPAHQQGQGLDPESDYAARRMSSSAISSASAQSAHSARTSSTAATSHSGYSAPSQNASLKRAQSPSGLDEYEAYDAFDAGESPRNVKRARPSLSHDAAPGSVSDSTRTDSASPAPTNTTTGEGRVQLPPLFSALENTSSSAPPTSHGAHAQFPSAGAMQVSYSHPSQSQGQTHSMSHANGNGGAFPTSNFAFTMSGSGLDLRRGSLPSLYSNSLAARSAQRLPNQGQGPYSTQNQQHQRQTSAYAYAGLSPGPSPLSALSTPGSAGTGDLSAYQFPPAPADGENAGESNGSGSGQGNTPTPTTTAVAAGTGTGGGAGGGGGTSPFTSSGMTPTSSLSSGASSGFPQTPMEFAQQQGSYQNAYGQREYDRFAKEYLTVNEWGSSSGSIARPASTGTPSSAYAYGGLPRISGHSSKSSEHQQQQPQEWFTPTGQYVSSSSAQHQQQQHHQRQHQHQHQHQHHQQASLSPPSRPHAGGGSSSSVSPAVAAAAAALDVSPTAAAEAAEVAAQVAARPARRRGKLPKPTTDFLKDWLHRHSDHPYPSEEEKKQLCHATGLSMSQVSNWMINARRRILAPAQRTPQGPTTTVPSFPLGSAHSSAGRTPLGLSPAHSHGHHGLSTTSHLSSNAYGMSMGSGLSGVSNMGLVSGMNGMGYQHPAQMHAGMSGVGVGVGVGAGASGMYTTSQQYRQQQQNAALYEMGLHGQRRASMPALALHSHSQQSHLSPLGGGSLQLYPASSAARSSLPQGYSQQQSYSPQAQLSSPTPQRGYVFPPPGSSGSNSGTGEDTR